MTTVRTLITDSYGETGILADGAEPSAEQLTKALRRLNALYASFFGAELGENLTTVNYGTSGLVNAYAISEDDSPDLDSTYVPTNIRLVLNNDAETTLYLDPNPNDGARFAVVDNAGNLATYNLTVNGNGRQIENTPSITLNTNAVNREWFYRADLGNWARIADLTEDDESPLPPVFDDLLVTALALRINPAYGAQTSQEMVDVFSRMKRLFKSRYSQHREVRSEDALLYLPTRRRYLRNAKTNFNLGRDY
jgi:hypothetical protein